MNPRGQGPPALTSVCFLAVAVRSRAAARHTVERLRRWTARGPMKEGTGAEPKAPREASRRLPPNARPLLFDPPLRQNLRLRR